MNEKIDKSLKIDSFGYSSKKDSAVEKTKKMLEQETKWSDCPVELKESYKEAMTAIKRGSWSAWLKEKRALKKQQGNK